MTTKTKQRAQKQLGRALVTALQNWKHGDLNDANVLMAIQVDVEFALQCVRTLTNSDPAFCKSPTPKQTGTYDFS